MKKLALLATLVAAVAGSVAVSSAFAVSPLFAQQSTGFGCVVQDHTGTPNVFTTQSSDTLYNSGKEQLHCWGVDPSPDGAYHEYTGFACGLVFTGISFNPANKNTISKTGASALTCFNDGFSAPASSASVGAVR